MTNEIQPKKDIRVYIISNIGPTRHGYIDEVCSYLDSDFRIFKPHTQNSYNVDNSQIENKVFLKDKTEIDKADISLILMPLFGRDCSSEIGYSSGIGNCTIAYVHQMETEQEKDWLNDWMVKGFLNCVITNNELSYEIIKNDPILKFKKIIFIENIRKLGEIVKDIYKEYYGI